MEVFYVGVAAFCGAVATSLLGWSKSKEPFVLRKFCGSLLKGLMAAVGVAVVFNYAEVVVPLSYLVAFLSGAGVDAGGKRLTDALGNIAK